MFLLISDAWKTKNWVDKFRIWFMPTGWRPADVEEKYPVFKINDVFNFEKYEPKSSTALKIWTFTQMLVLLFFVSFLFGNIAQIGSPGIFYYGLFIFLYIYSLAELMDRNYYAYVWEALKSILGIYLLFPVTPLLGEISIPQKVIVAVEFYLLASMIITAYFSVQHKKEDKQLAKLI
jgi:hypothetical protein